MVFFQNITDILQVGWRIIEIVILLSILVVGHEFGHFIVARMSGMRVDEFAVGFGKRLWSITRGETAYSINLFPLGGYCKIYGMDVEDEAELKKQAEEFAKAGKPPPSSYFESIAPRDDPRAFVNRPIHQRIGVILAGPAANILIGILMVFLMGVTIGFPAAEIGNVIPGGPADVGGLQAGDIITYMNGTRLSSTDDLQRTIQFSMGNPIYLAGIRADEEFDVRIMPQELRLVDSNFCRLGFIYMNDGTVLYNLPDSPAERAGLIPGDIITKVAGLMFSMQNLDIEPGSGILPLEVYRDYKQVRVSIDYFDDEINLDHYSPFGYFFNDEQLVTKVVPRGIADDAGLRDGDLITGGELTIWDSSGEAISDVSPMPVTLLCEREGRKFSVKLEPDPIFSRIQVYMDDASRPVLMNLPYEHRLYQSGLRSGDEILSIEGTPTLNGISAFLEFQKYFGQSVSVVALSDGVEKIATVPMPDLNTGEKELSSFFAGLHFQTRYFKSSFSGAIKTGIVKTGDIIKFIFMTLGMLASGEIGIKDLAGPVGIVNITYQAATNGFVDLLNMMILLTINLAIFNLLPFPALDGGRILFMLPELIFRRQVITPRIENFIHFAGFLILLLFAVFVAYNDVARIFFGR
ncbi:MAG: site-2 protease family protein [bacterium]|nr:site-2 protease family protein [bacterium]